MTFYERLSDLCKRQGSFLCIGLDVNLEKFPPFLLEFEDPIVEFNKSIIHATSDLVCAYKLNTAFYEAYGVQGWRSLKKTLRYIPDSVITIADAKRGDIAHSAQMYAKAFFRELNFDAITVNPYLGYDAVEPFLMEEGKGVFVLCVTSNPGAKDFQLASGDSKPLYERVAEAVVKWNTKGNCGLVVGATQIEPLKRVRQIAPQLPLLIPGVGFQGGNLEQAVTFGLNERGEGILINVGRGVIYRSEDYNFAEEARKAAQEIRDQINRTVTKLRKSEVKP